MDEYRTATKIGRNTYLMRDSRQMWIARGRKNKTGGIDYVRTSGYYTTFEKLFNGLAILGTLTSGGDDLTDALDQLTKYERRLKELGRKIGKELDEKYVQENLGENRGTNKSRKGNGK